MVHCPALPPQQDVQPAVIVAHPRLGQVPDSHPQSRLLICHAPVAVAGPGQGQDTAGTALRHAVGDLEVLRMLCSFNGPFTLRSSCQFCDSSGNVLNTSYLACPLSNVNGQTAYFERRGVLSSRLPRLQFRNLRNHGAGYRATQIPGQNRTGNPIDSQVTP